MQTGKELNPYHIKYYKHISAEDSVQDLQSAFSYRESMHVHTNRDTSHVIELIVQSDNARS